MDEQQFDRLAQSLGRGLNRRSVLGILAGAAGLGVGEVVAKRHRGRSRVQAAAANKVTLCHHDQDTDTWSPISISNNGKAVEKHKANHGDFAFGSGQASDCCTDADCGDNETCVITVDAAGIGSGSCQSVGCTGNFCRDQSFCGGGDCFCFVKVDGTTHVCAGSGLCAVCASDDECTAVTGPGSVCINTTGPFCACSGTACQSPCGASGITAAVRRGGQPNP